MTKLGIVKLVVNIVVATGVSKVTNDVISNNVDIESTEDQIKVAIGSVIIGSMIAEAASTHVNGKIDSIANVWKNRKDIKNDVKVVVEDLTIEVVE